MARVSLQFKSVASLLLTAAASLSAAIAVRKFFEHSMWEIPTACLACTISTQIALLFIESKEEEELSLFRQQRLRRIRHAGEEREKITLRIQQDIESGSLKSAERWRKFRKEMDD